MAITRSERKDWAREHFRGAENILLPSFDADLAELDEEAIRHDVRQSIRHGVFSTFCAIEVGLTPAEKRRFLSIAADEAGEEICVGFALAGDSFEEDVELLQHAEQAGCSHALVSYPLTFRPESQDEVHDAIRELCDATDLGIVLFVNDKFGLHRLHPSFVPFDAFDRLADVDNVVAVKASGLDLAMVTECFDRYADRLAVSVPNIRQLPLIMSTFDMRWTGAWSIEALQTPERPYVVEVIEELLAGRQDEAMERFWRAGPAMGVIGQWLQQMFPTGAYHQPLFKYFQWLSGGNGGMTRQPAMRLSARDMAQVRGGFLASGLDVTETSDAEFAIGRSATREAVAR